VIVCDTFSVSRSFRIDRVYRIHRLRAALRRRRHSLSHLLHQQLLSSGNDGQPRRHLAQVGYRLSFTLHSAPDCACGVSRVLNAQGQKNAMKCYPYHEKMGLEAHGPENKMLLSN